MYTSCWSRAAASRWTRAIHCLSGTQLSQKCRPPYSSFHAALTSLSPATLDDAVRPGRRVHKVFKKKTCTWVHFSDITSVLCYFLFSIKRTNMFRTIFGGCGTWESKRIIMKRWRIGCNKWLFVKSGAGEVLQCLLCFYKDKVHLKYQLLISSAKYLSSHCGTKRTFPFFDMNNKVGVQRKWWHFSFRVSRLYKQTQEVASVPADWQDINKSVTSWWLAAV